MDLMLKDMSLAVSALMSLGLPCPCRRSREPGLPHGFARWFGGFGFRRGGHADGRGGASPMIEEWQGKRLTARSALIGGIV